MLPGGAAWVVVEETDGRTSFNECAGRWVEIARQHRTSMGTITELDVVPAPWLSAGQRSELVEVAVGATEGLAVVQARSCGPLGDTWWPESERSLIGDVVAEAVESQSASDPESLVEVIVTAVRTRAAELAAAELSELTDDAFAALGGESSSPALSSPTEDFIARLWAIRSRQRTAQSACRGRGAEDSSMQDLIGRTIAEVDSITTLVMTRQLLDQSRSAQQLADAQRAAELAVAAQRESEEATRVRDERALALLAALFLAPTLVLGFFGISNSPRFVFGVDQQSVGGQLAIVGLAIASAVTVYILIRLHTRKGS